MYSDTNCKIDRIISRICNYECEYFLNKKNVVGIGLGYKVKNGFCAYEKCIKVFVIKKLSKINLLKKDLIPLIYKGIKTDVIETGVFTTASLTEKIVPAIGGYVIGNELNDTISGTLGCLVTDQKDLFLLTNNHIIALSNDAPLESKILQPSLKYGGKLTEDVIGNLAKYVPVKFKSGFRNPTNYVDCALGKLITSSSASPEIALVGIPEGIKSSKLNEDIKKVGFKTELTRGKVKTLSSSIQIMFPNQKTSLFKNQITATKMNELGDSGALVLDNNNHAIGLLMGNTDTETVINPINTVLKNLNVSIVTRSLLKHINHLYR